MSGVDASLFSQSLMYHCHRYARHGWAGEPEIDPTLEYAEREQVEGWEITPQECMDLAHGGVLREKAVEAGVFLCFFCPHSVLKSCTGSSTACIVTLNASSGLLRAAKWVLCLVLVAILTPPSALAIVASSSSDPRLYSIDRVFKPTFSIVQGPYKPSPLIFALDTYLGNLPNSLHKAERSSSKHVMILPLTLISIKRFCEMETSLLPM